MIQKKIDLNLVPENIKNIIQRANPQNPHVNDNERMIATSQLENIIALCEKSLEIYSTMSKKRG